jgi:hypothetical protein
MVSAGLASLACNGLAMCLLAFSVHHPETPAGERKAPIAKVIELEPVQDDPAHIVQFAQDRIEPAHKTAAIEANELHGDYAKWCRRQGIDALSLKVFVHGFDQLRETPGLKGMIAKHGTRYHGIKLAEAKVTRLPARVPRLGPMAQHS